MAGPSSWFSTLWAAACAGLTQLPVSGGRGPPYQTTVSDTGPSGVTFPIEVTVKPFARSPCATVAAWLATAVPFSTETLTLEGVGRGRPVKELVPAATPKIWSTTSTPVGWSGNSTRP